VALESAPAGGIVTTNQERWCSLFRRWPKKERARLAGEE
jgi:hypothetical protein